jgi:hypothetical protein
MGDLLAPRHMRWQGPDFNTWSHLRRWTDAEPGGAEPGKRIFVPPPVQSDHAMLNFRPVLPQTAQAAKGCGCPR